MLFGVFDGHAGASCGKVVAKRLLHYVAAGLLSIDDLRSHLSGNIVTETIFIDCFFLQTRNLIFIEGEIVILTRSGH